MGAKKLSAQVYYDHGMVAKMWYDHGRTSRTASYSLDATDTFRIAILSSQHRMLSRNNENFGHVIQIMNESMRCDKMMRAGKGKL